jgi:hypothetical protein
MFVSGMLCALFGAAGLDWLARLAALPMVLVMFRKGYLATRFFERGLWRSWSAW